MGSYRSGFTLLELLVAIAILALLAVFSWRTLDAITRTSDALKISSERIDGLARVFSAMENDAALATSADLPAQGELRLLAPGGGVAYAVDQNQLLRTLAGGEPGLIANGVVAMHVDVLRVTEIKLGDAAALAGSLNNTLASSGNAASSSAPTNPASTAPLTQQRVVGIKVALTLDNGDVVTRLLLLNSA